MFTETEVVSMRDRTGHGSERCIGIDPIVRSHHKTGNFLSRCSLSSLRSLGAGRDLRWVTS